MLARQRSLDDLPSPIAPATMGMAGTLLRSCAMGLEACRSYYAAAVLYEELRVLSDVELRRRGLARDSLARDICAHYDQAPCR